MSYYHCTTDILRKEIRRRGYVPNGSREELSEWLQLDDEERGSEATTVIDTPRESVTRANEKRTVYGEVVQPSELVGEEIIHWTMNTFFPTLQLFFKSGRSCTIACGQSNSSVGLDTNLRFRLTDLTHEENGVIVKGVLPSKLSNPRPSIKIIAAELADRVSIRPRPMKRNGRRDSVIVPTAEIVGQMHTTVGIALDGMQEMGYVWARADSGFQAEAEAIWSKVWIAGVRDDVPLPLVCLPPPSVNDGNGTRIVTKESMIRWRSLAEKEN